jgi:hypothetical protein
MARIAPKLKLDYSLEIRYRLRDGNWSPWINHGKGKFETIEIVQRQIRMLVNYPEMREKEVRFIWNGIICDFAGNKTGQVISLK